MVKYFYLGANIHQELLDVICRSTDSIVLYETENAGNVEELIRSMEKNGKSYSIDKKNIDMFAHGSSLSTKDDRERIVRKVLNDYKVFLLRMRFLRVDFEGAFRAFEYFSDVVDFALNLAERDQPETVFCSYTPHTVESWLVVRTFEELGARVVRLITSPLPWILLPVEGLENKSGCNLEAKLRTKRSGAVDRYLSILRGDYAAAMPYYEKLAKRLAIGRLLSAMAKWRPRDFAKYLERRAVQKEFERASSGGEVEGSYAVYFLHYQPEMNTLPEADLYCDQFQAVKKLVDALPPGIQLLIKEHPSTFSKRCDRRWRPSGFYDRMLSLPNTSICPSHIDTFDLIDHSVFVASIAGVCLTEALARGIPAVSFYTPRFALFEDGLVVDANLHTVSELRDLFAHMVEGAWTIDENKLRASFDHLMANGYDGALDDTYLPQAAEQSYANSRRANYLAIQDVLDGVL